jgi:HEAT repeat protein
MRSWLAVSLLVLAAVPATASAQEKFLGRAADEWSQKLAASQGQERVYAAWALAQMAGQEAGGPGDHVHFAELVKLISDGDASVRYWGAQGLSNYAQQLKPRDSGRGAAINALLPLLEDKAAAPRIAAALAVGQLGKPDKALPILVAGLSEPQEAARIQAVSALEQLGPAARPALETLQKATSDNSEYVKRISERALAKLSK